MRLRVEDCMTRCPVTAAPQLSVLNARRLLHRHSIRHLPVMDGDRLVGMVSDRDLALGEPWVTGSLTGLQSSLVSGRYRSVAAVMSSPVHVARVGESIAFAAEQMLRWRVSALPVVDRDKLVGILTTTDCLTAITAARTERREDASLFDLAGYDPDDCKMTPMPPGDERPGRASSPSRSAQQDTRAYQPAQRVVRLDRQGARGRGKIPVPRT